MSTRSASGLRSAAALPPRSCLTSGQTPPRADFPDADCIRPGEPPPGLEGGTARRPRRSSGFYLHGSRAEDNRAEEAVSPETLGTRGSVGYPCTPAAIAITGSRHHACRQPRHVSTHRDADRGATLPTSICRFLVFAFHRYDSRRGDFHAWRLFSFHWVRGEWSGRKGLL